MFGWVHGCEHFGYRITVSCTDLCATSTSWCYSSRRGHELFGELGWLCSVEVVIGLEMVSWLGVVDFFAYSVLGGRVYETWVASIYFFLFTGGGLVLLCGCGV